MLRLAGQVPPRAILYAGARQSGHRIILRRNYALEAKPQATSPVAAPAGPGTPAVPTGPTAIPPPETPLIAPPPPPKRRFGFLSRLLFFSAALTATFYGVSTVMALRNDRFHDFFVESIPLGESIMDYIDEKSLEGAAAHIRAEVKRVAGDIQRPESSAPSAEPAATSTSPAPVAPPPSAGPPGLVTSPPALPTAPPMPPMAPPFSGGVSSSDQAAVKGPSKASKDLSRSAEALKERAEKAVKGLSDRSGRQIHEIEDHLKSIGQKAMSAAGALTRGGRSEDAGKPRPNITFSEGVEELVNKVETALQGQAAPKGPAPAVPASGVRVDAGAPPPVPEPSEEAKRAAAGKVYTGPLPLGFEPPPGYSRPGPKSESESTKKPPPSTAPPSSAAPSEPSTVAEPPKVPEAGPAVDPLPLVSSLLRPELTAAEPVIGQLASTIDSLSSFLTYTSNPTALSNARGVIETAQMDLEQLAERMEHVKEEERQALEKRMEAAREEWQGKLRAIEKEAQDKLDKQEDGWKSAFEEERTKLVNAYKEKLQGELSTQGEIINERLKEEVIAQGIELQRRWIRDIKVRVEQERGNRLAKLDSLSTSLKQLERLTLDNSAYLDENLRVHGLWSALRALQTAIDSPVRRPFRNELRVLHNLAAARDDPVVNAALDSLEASDVPDIGVEPYTDLATWFTTTVYPRVVSVALVPDENAGVLAHMASSVLSNLRFRRQGLVEGNDVLGTLARAEYYVTEKDLDSAARELNQLKGTAKVLLADWLDAARRRLEVQQALEVVNTQATLASLLVV